MIIYMQWLQDICLNILHISWACIAKGVCLNGREGWNCFTGKASGDCFQFLDVKVHNVSHRFPSIGEVRRWNLNFCSDLLAETVAKNYNHVNLRNSRQFLYLDY